MAPPSKLHMTAPGLLAVILALLARPAAAADLLEVLRRAQSADATYAAARASWQAAQEKIPQGLAGLLPKTEGKE